MSILRPGSNCMGVYQVERTGLLVDACDYYRAFYHSALLATRYILLAGWQFDSEVRLVRGKDAEGISADVRLVNFLDALCRSKPELEIYILAWDFSAIFSLEREWFQSVIFGWSTNERLHFRLDSKHAAGATHHQKFVVLDGSLAFLGGMDICASRWDDRRHLKDNPERVEDGKPYGSYHDIQSYHTGPVVAQLADLFIERWGAAGPDDLVLPACQEPIPFHLPEAIPLPTRRVALSRTRAGLPEPGAGRLLEIRHLFVDAILAAQQLIYLENQYFSSEAVYWSLVARMAMPERPPLQIVLMLPDRLPFTEELFLGLPQMKMLRSLTQVAQKTGHGFGVFCTACLEADGARKLTFIHSKLLLVDDRFLSVGSANATNRSMGLDTELNVSWEADREDAELSGALRRVRASLLAEHAGLFGQGKDAIFEEVPGLIERLGDWADDPESRLCRYEPEPSLEGSELLEALEPIARVVDPERPVDGEYVFESLSKYQTSSFAKGIRKLSQILIGL